MVVFLELNDDDPHLLLGGGNHSAYERLKHSLRGPLLQAGRTEDARGIHASEEEAETEERANPNLNGFSAALSCYP